MSEAPFTSDDFEFKGTAGDLREWSMRQPEIGLCVFCPDWRVEGQAREVQELALRHRLEKHPEIKYKKSRHRPALMRWRSTLNEEQSQEIAEVREKRMRLLGIPDGEATP